MEVKPTEYNGISFRSKLEAQYALLFDLLYQEWYYEPAKFDIGLYEKQVYIPDFYLACGYWIEVKPANYEGAAKHEEFAGMMKGRYIITKGSVLESEEYSLVQVEGKPLSFQKTPSFLIRNLIHNYQPVGPTGEPLSVPFDIKLNALKHYVWNFDFDESRKNDFVHDYGATMINRNDMSMKMLRLLFHAKHGRWPALSKDSSGCPCCEYNEPMNVSTSGTSPEFKCMVCFTQWSEEE